MAAPSSTELEPILKGMRKGQTIEQFMAEGGTLEIDFHRKCDEMIERVIRFLQQNISISVAKIIKGGSIGKNTILGSQSDVDLFIFLNDLKSIRDMRMKTREILDRIRSKLDSDSWHYSAGTIEFQSYTDHSIKFIMSCPDLGQRHTIDILPAYDILQHLSAQDVYTEMMNLSENEREFYSVCLGPLQVKFIKEAPCKVQSLMKIIKYWTKVEVNTDTKSTSSYFIEALVMNRWVKSGRPHDFIISDWFEEILSDLTGLDGLSVVWEDRYTATKYRTLPPPPVVLDPVNPYKNLAPTGKHGDKVVKLARRVLRRVKKLREYLQSGPPPVLQDMRRGQTLQQFIVETIQPGSESRRDCDQVVERVTYFLQHHTNFSVSMVIKGGSLGKSTNISGKSDVDLVVFINEVTSVKDLQANMECLLKTLMDDLASKWTGFAGFLNLERKTAHGLQYSLSCSDGGHVHEVDILPACNVLENHTENEVYAEMSKKGQMEREYYSVCFAPKQVEFVKQVPIKVKNLIRLVKYWAKTELNKERKVVTSYFLESLVMYNWTESTEFSSQEGFNTNDWFKRIMTQLASLKSIRILWPKRYTAASYYHIHELFPEGPVLLDPCNPFRNLVPREKYHDLVMERAGIVVRKIQDLYLYRHGKYLDN